MIRGCENDPVWFEEGGSDGSIKSKEIGADGVEPFKEDFVVINGEVR